jgi:hypothetical protein
MANVPTKVRDLTLPYLVMVHRADPDFERQKRKEIEYKFTGRTFSADPSKRGPYEP